MHSLLVLVLATVINIVPQPQCVVVEKGTFKLKNASVSCDAAIGPKAQAAVADFAAQLTLATGRTYAAITPIGLVANIQAGTARGLVFLHDASLVPEAYTIDISKGLALVKASDFNGIFYAIQSLKQMLPLEIYGNKLGEGAKWELPCCHITDVPRFAYRGMHLDCGRHFFSVDEIKKVLDMMATVKLNRFHWHLTEDQGWRAEIKKYPRLTEVGAWRSGTMVGYYDGPSDGVRYGGFYTQEQMRDVVAYADKLGITIVPEVDLPGHMVAALASYPELGCTGGPYEVWYHWGVHPDVLCLGRESTYKFLEDVLGELCDIFPGEYFHIGGDEAPDTRWHDCPDCQAKIAELGLTDGGGVSAERRLQNYVTKRMQDFLATRGKKIIGWDEILEGELAQGATVMSWRGSEGGIKASNMGYDVIMTPSTHCYFDYCQDEKTYADGWDRSKNSEEPTCAFWGQLTTEMVYSFNPTAGLDEKAAAHILGAQANVWTEYIGSDSQLEYMIMPRLFAMSEVQWSQPSNKDWSRAKAWIETFGYGILEQKGFNFRRMK